MSIDKVKYVVIPVLYVFAVMAFVTSMFFIQKTLTDMVLQDDGDNFDLVSNVNPIEVDTDLVVFDNTPVVLDDKYIVKPYLDESVSIVRNFYDYTNDATTQENSLIYYEQTYMQNSGIDYSSSNSNFDIVSIYDGTVIEVKEDDLLGKIIQIRHSNDMISIYQSLSEVTVKVDDNVSVGQVIGKSGTNNISSSLNDHLHFELIYKGQMVNPEDYFGKNPNQL